MRERIDKDVAYLDMAEVWAQRSKAERLQVGCLVVSGKDIISDGYNGMPWGDDTPPEERLSTGLLVSRPEVIHAEMNAIFKASRGNKPGLLGSTFYCTHSPCLPCAVAMREVGATRVVYRHVYRESKEALKHLRKYGVIVEQLKKESK